MFRIACICSNATEYRNVMQSTLPENYFVDAAELVLDEAVQYAQKCEQMGYDLIISRGITYKILQRTVNVPVTAIDITYFDIISALYESKRYVQSGDCNIEFFLYRGSSPRREDLYRMLDMLSIEQSCFRVHEFRNGSEIERILDAEDPQKTIVLSTGAFVANRAEQRGFRTISIRSTNEALFHAISDVRLFLESSNNNSVLKQQMQSMIESLCSGIILLDENRSILYVSAQIIELLAIEHGNPIGRPFSDIFGQSRLKNIFREKSCRFPVGDGYIAAELQHILKGSEGNGYGIALSFVKQEKAPSDKQGRSPARAAKYSLDDLLGKSAAIDNLRKKIALYSSSDFSILICGESGTGKEIIANSLHNASARRSGPFVAVNCAALPQTLLESELFGYESGAFTGAKKEGHSGLFEQANGGTIFLDEISEISPGAQAQLLRVLQERTVRRVGGTKNIPLDVRVIAATNVDIWQHVQEGKFREDLFYRLNTLYLHVPPLRERREDIPVLFKAFVGRYQSGRRLPVSSAELSWLLNYDWPGNVRELLSFSQKFAMLYDDSQDVSQLISELLDEMALIRHHPDRRPPAAKPEAPDNDCITISVGSLDEMEMDIIRELLKRYPNKRSAMARDLGISRTSLWKRIKQIEDIDRMLK